MVNAKPAALADHASTIRVLHSRYEAAYAEYNVIDRAEGALADDPADHKARFAYETAKGVNDAELEALRVAILYQVPVCWVDAMTLQFHIHSVSDMLANSAVSDAEQAALFVGIDTLFDFMCCEVRQDHEELGGQFQAGANRVFFARRRRTGIVED